MKQKCLFVALSISNGVVEGLYGTTPFRFIESLVFTVMLPTEATVDKLLINL